MHRPGLLTILAVFIVICFSLDRLLEHICWNMYQNPQPIGRQKDDEIRFSARTYYALLCM